MIENICEPERLAKGAVISFVLASFFGVGALIASLLH